MKKQQGFTLIELIVVIIILGILAAVALPRFVDLQVQARQSKLQAGVGAVRAGAALFHAQCLAALASISPITSSCNPLSMEGLSVTGFNNYPTADLSGIIPAAGLNAGVNTAAGVDYWISNPGVSTTLTIQVPAPTSGSCEFTYTPSATAAPTVSLSGTGACN